MHASPKNLAAYLSFFLPGLGQLSQRRFAYAIAFFLTFISSTLLSQVWWLTPFIALLSGIETFRFPGAQMPGDRRLKISYSIVASIGFLAWFTYLGNTFFPLAKQMTANEDVQAIRIGFRQCVGADRTPQKAAACLHSGGGRRDPWGSEYALGWGEGVLEIHSAGPDRQMGTDDDLFYRNHEKEVMP